MNLFEEKTDSELISYFPDYQKLCFLDKYTGFQNPDFTAILKSYREKFGPIGEGVLGHDFFEAVFHRREKTTNFHFYGMKCSVVQENFQFSYLIGYFLLISDSFLPNKISERSRTHANSHRFF